MKPLTLHELADKVNGVLINHTSNGSIEDITVLDEAGPESASFLTSAKLKDQMEDSKAAVILIPGDIEIADRPVIQLENVWSGVKILLNYFYPDPPVIDYQHPTAIIAPTSKMNHPIKIDAQAIIENNVEIGENVKIGARAYIGSDVKIGKGTIIHPNVTILEQSEIGENCIIHPGVVIGADGFKFEKINNLPVKIPQIGKVVIEDDVEIGANTCIDRASFTETRIGMGTKIDNLVHIAHNCRVGKYCFIVAQVGIAGSTHVGNGCILAGQVGLADNLTLEDGVTLAAQSGVMHNIPAGETWFGTPAQPINKEMRQIALQKKLEDMLRDIRTLKTTAKTN